MALKSVVQIEIDDTKFQAWLKQTHNVTVSPNVDGGNGGGKNNPPSRPNTPVPGSIYTPNQIKQQQAKEKKFWSEVSKTGLGFAKSLTSATISLTKWSAALGVGAVYGMGRLGKGVAADAYKARGLGISTAQQKAIAISYSALVEDTNSVLTKIQESQLDYQKKIQLAAIGSQYGVSFEGKNPAEIFSMMMPMFKDWVDKQGNSLSEQSLSASQFGAFFDLTTAKRNQAISQAEIPLMEQRNINLVKELSLGKETQDSYIALTQQASAAGEQIENTFIKGLVALNDPLIELSRELTETIEKLAGSQSFKESILLAGHAINEFANYLTKPEFKQGMEDFLEFLRHPWKNSKDAIIKGIKGDNRTITGAMASGGLKSIGESFFWLAEKSKDAALDMTVNAFSGKYFDNAMSAVDNKMSLLKMGIPKLADALVGPESSGNPNAISPKGAKGLHQFMPDTFTGLGYDLKDINNPVKSRQAAIEYLGQLAPMFDYDLEKTIAAYNAGPNAIKRQIKEAMESGSDWHEKLYPETRQYIPKVMENFKKMSTNALPPKISLNVNAPPGQNVSVAANQGAYFGGPTGVIV